MEFRKFDSTSSMLPVIGQGTWYIDNGDPTAAIAALRLGLDLGMTPIDTAEMYGKPDHTAENAGAGDLGLTRTELAQIDEAFPPGSPPQVFPVL